VQRRLGAVQAFAKGDAKVAPSPEGGEPQRAMNEKRFEQQHHARPRALRSRKDAAANPCHPFEQEKTRSMRNKMTSCVAEEDEAGHHPYRSLGS